MNFWKKLCKAVGYGEGEIHGAAERGDLKRVATLIKRNPNLVFCRKWVDWTPLLCAARDGHKEVVDLLLANKADITAANSDGLTALHMAASNGHKDVVKSLLSHKANVNAQKGESNSTPLYWAASEGHKEVVELLLANGANVNGESYNGCTPLHGAAKEGRKEVVKVLLAHKANINTKNIRGETPLQAAADKGHKQIVELLHDSSPKTKRHGDSSMQGSVMVFCFENEDAMIQAIRACERENSALWQRCQTRKDRLPQSKYPYWVVCEEDDVAAFDKFPINMGLKHPAQYDIENPTRSTVEAQSSLYVLK